MHCHRNMYDDNRSMRARFNSYPTVCHTLEAADRIIRLIMTEEGMSRPVFHIAAYYVVQR